jgi:hypothetical protein
MNTLSGTSSMLSLVAATAARAHVVAAAHGMLPSPSSVPMPGTPLPVVLKLLPLPPRTPKARSPPPIVLVLRSRAPSASLSSPQPTTPPTPRRLLPCAPRGPLPYLPRRSPDASLTSPVVASRPSRASRPASGRLADVHGCAWGVDDCA